jgi:formaldehyde-activating enzyme involved in methanogenesis
MSTKGWIFTLVGAGVVVAVVIGLLGQSQTVAEKQFCNGLASLSSSVQSLTSLDASSATQDDFQSDVSAVQSSWNDVKSDAQNLSSIYMSSLDSAWSDFESAVKSVPSSASVSDAEQTISDSAKGLQSTVQSNMQSYDCSSS